MVGSNLFSEHLNDFNKLISVIVPIYNAEQYLKRAIDSIVNQTYTSIEIILVDDGSTDGSGLICDNYLKSDSRVKVFHKSNEGVSSARNFGVKQASGKYIIFVDSDDHISKDCVELLNKKMEESNADIVLGRYCIDKHGQIINTNENLHSLCEDKNVLLYFIGKDKVLGSSCRTLFKKTIFNRFQFDVNVKYCEDLCFMLKLINNNLRFDYIDNVIYYYYVNKNSVTQKLSEDTTKNYYNGMINCLTILKDFKEYKLIKSNIEFEIFRKSIIQSVRLKHDYYTEYDLFNSKENYKLYLKCNSGLKSKIIAWLCHRKALKILGLLIRIQSVIE